MKDDSFPDPQDDSTKRKSKLCAILQTVSFLIPPCPFIDCFDFSLSVSFKRSCKITLLNSALQFFEIKGIQLKRDDLLRWGEHNGMEA
jgi:hypothetical protein